MSQSRFIRGLLRLLVRGVLKPAFAAHMPFTFQRAIEVLSRANQKLPASARFIPETLGGVRGERVGESRVPGAAVLYFHGGGYCIGGPQTARPLTARLAEQTGLVVHAPDYRLAPEHPSPAATDDGLAAYHALLEAGVKRIVLAGDSAGAGLALATALNARDAGLPLPAALLLVSPFVDLACASASHRERAARDPMLTPDGLRRWGQSYSGALPPGDPLRSPLFADLRGLPPVLIQVGSEEVLFDDSQDLARRLQAAGVQAELRVEPGLWHVYPLHAGVLREADAAIGDMAAFLAARGITPRS